MFGMILEIPENLPPGYGEGLNLILWALVSFLLLLMLPMGLNSARKQEFEHLKKAEIARGAFGVFYGMARIFFILGVKVNGGADYDFWVILGYLFSMIGLSWLIFTYEYYKLGRKAPFFTALGILSALTTFTGFENLVPGFRNVPRNTILGIISGTSAVLVSLIAYIYFKTMARFPGELRSRTFYEFIGLILLLLGIIFDGTYFITRTSAPMFFRMYMPGIMAIFGVLLINFSHDLKKWAYRSFAYIALITVFVLFVMHASEL